MKQEVFGVEPADAFIRRMRIARIDAGNGFEEAGGGGDDVLFLNALADGGCVAGGHIIGGGGGKGGGDGLRCVQQQRGLAAQCIDRWHHQRDDSHQHDPDRK